jgi:c(7)-type cytochrome triheme protein
MVRAMRAGAVAGWVLLAMVGLAPTAGAGELRLPADIVYSKHAQSPGRVVFSHQTHVAVSEKCTACHNALFRMLTPTHAVSHVEMEAGRSCGSCHNDAMAFGSKDPAGCGRCHGAAKP